MSTSLLFDCWRIDEPAATDPLDQRTWASLRVIVEGRCVTRFWDRRSASEREAIYVPTFPLARWIVSNWWQLLYEPCRAESPPVESDRWLPEERHWVHRHCFRSAESGLFLPYLHFYSDGPGVSVAWSMDDAHAFPRMPGYFLYSGFAQFDALDAMTAMSDFVEKVLGWCSDLADDRVEMLRADWTAITNADAEEKAFCRGAGRMGLDPYAIDEWNSELVNLLTVGLGARIEDALARDFLESTDAGTAKSVWQWVSNAERDFDLKAGKSSAIDPGHGFRHAKDQGYFVAHQVRSLAGLVEDEPIEHLAALLKRVGKTTFLFESNNHSPSRAVHAAVGWRDSTDAVVAGPQLSRPENQRFLESRGLYQALVGCQEGARLVTRAHTWDQQASRAFAAELLAPRKALALHTRADLEADERRELEQQLANHYQVSAEVVRLQLRNVGVWRQFDESS